MDDHVVRMPLTARVVAMVRTVNPRTWQLVDVVVAVSLFVGLVTPVLLGHPQHADPPGAVLGFGAASTLPLAVRRRWPVTVLVVVVAATVLAALVGVRFTPLGSNAGPSIALAMYTAAERSSSRGSRAALALVVGVTFATAWVATAAHPEEDENAVHVLAAFVGWVVGDTVRVRRTYRRELAALQFRETEERTRLALAEERLRISREVRDVVSHNLSVITVRAGVGRMLFDARPELARAALSDVESVGRAALTELRTVLGSVRDQRQPPAPAPRLADLPALADRMSASGVSVAIERRGDVPRLPATLELTAFRIVQEALTNVAKHAGPTRAHVTLEHRGSDLLVEVTNEATGRSTVDSPGWGIAGMRERAALFGGTVVAEPTPEGGFRVSARLTIAPGNGHGSGHGNSDAGGGA